MHGLWSSSLQPSTDYAMGETFLEVRPLVEYEKCDNAKFDNIV